MTLEIPAIVPADDPQVSGAERTGVVVIGGGMAGMCAAVSAAEHGAKVVLLERAAVLGGTTAMAGGHFYLGGGTAVQKATGQEDTPEAMAAYLTEMSIDPDPEKITAYAEGSPEHLDWLEALGFEFERSFFPGKAVIQPNTEGLMYTGNEKVYPYSEKATPAPRGHKVPIPGDTGGAAMVVDKLAERAEALGVEIRFEIGARQLVVEGSGADARVVGVAWKAAGGEEGVLLGDAVVLAAGGFVLNEAMVEHYAPRLLETKSMPLGSTFDDGLGIRLGQSVGARTRFMDKVFVTAPFYPPSRLVTGLVVNAAGERFVAEDSYHARMSSAVLDQPEGRAYLIVDSAHMTDSASTYYGLTPFVDGFETVEAMAEGIGVPVDALRATLERYNTEAAEGRDEQFHKYSDWIEPQTEAPWGVFDLSAGKALYNGFTVGGLDVNVDGQVRTESGDVVPGLYAAGATASTLAQDGAGYSSGTQLGAGSFFGRRAGRRAAQG